MKIYELFTEQKDGESFPHKAVANKLDCNIIVSEFEL